MPAMASTSSWNREPLSPGIYTNIPHTSNALCSGPPFGVHVSPTSVVPPVLFQNLRMLAIPPLEGRERPRLALISAGLCNGPIYRSPLCFAEGLSGASSTPP